MMLRRRRPLFGSSLASRLIWLIVAVMLLIELVILMPGLGRERQAWMWDRVTQAHLAAFLAYKAPHDQELDADLLRLTASDAIFLQGPNFQGANFAVAIPPDVKMQTPDEHVALDHETLLTSMWLSDLAVLGLDGRLIEVTAHSPLKQDMTVQLLLDGRLLTQALRAYVARLALFSALIALITGLVAFIALDRMLVRPMRGLTASIVSFRRDPEHLPTSELGWLNIRRDDDVSKAARELARMQEDLREALWRNGRLATLGTAMAKVTHDLRNILSSALLVSDRLRDVQEPAMRRAAMTLIGAVERATRLVGETVDFVRDGPPLLKRTKVTLRAVVEEVARALDGDVKVRVENAVPPQLCLALDRAQIYRVLINLLRNAVEAGATRVDFLIDYTEAATLLLVVDNGPGLPLRARENLFRPFAGSGRAGGTGLGLSIARDLVRAHGGDLSLKSTGPDGTAFIVHFTQAVVLSSGPEQGLGREADLLSTS